MQTPRAPLFVELPRIKGSRFLGGLAPAPDEDAARTFVEAVRQEHRKASHVAFAWRLDATNTRASDDGEVSGTAGPPLLTRLESHDLQAVLAVVRYYGGTNLGKGGLVRAYGGCADAVIAGANLVEHVPRVRRVLVVPSAHGSAALLALGQGGFQVEDARWGAEVVFRLEGPGSAEEALRQRVAEVLRGVSPQWSNPE